jgi:hypothetical protein
MTALSIQPTFPIFTDIDGQPLEAGYIFIGVANLAPIGNPINVYWDAALTLAAVQPIRTIGGYPVNNGTPARLYVNSDYSIQVQNRNGSVVYSAPAATERYGNVISFADITGTLGSDRVSFLQAGTGAVTRTAQAKMRDVVSVLDFGAPTDGVGDCYAAFQAAINALPVSGGTIIIPATTLNSWVISQTLNVRRKVHMIGQIAQGTGEKGTTLVFPANTSGIVFNSYNTSLYDTVAVDPLLPGAYGSILENVAFFGDKAGSSTAADGVVVRCSMECRGVAARNFFRYGFRIYADLGTGGSTEGDANQWTLYRCQAIANGDHGVYVNGDDANTGVAIKVFSQLNGGYGIFDNSLIGNTYIGCDTVGNTLGSMSATRASAANTIIGLWEDGAATSQFDGASQTIIGGNGGNPSVTSSVFSMWGGIAQRKPYQYINNRGSQQVGAQLGANYNDTTMTVMAYGAATAEGGLSTWKFQFDAAQNVWFLQYAGSTSFQPIAYPNSSGALWTNKKFTGAIFQNGYAVKNAGATYSTAKVRMLGTAPPTTDTYEQGDIFYNSAPSNAAGQPIGWVCVVSGTPGTWRPFGVTT